MESEGFQVELTNFGFMTLADVLKVLNKSSAVFSVARLPSRNHLVSFRDKNLALLIQKINDSSIEDNPVEIAKKLKHSKT